jgi:predicted small lipoprotein YifL
MTLRSLSRAALVMGLCLPLMLTACGRRGPLEPPPSQKAKETTQTGSEVENADENVGFVPNPVSTPKTKRGQGFKIPQEPFILDPLL